jgi:hypothetical protein
MALGNVGGGGRVNGIPSQEKEGVSEEQAVAFKYEVK